VVNQGLRIVGSDGIWEVDSQDRGIFYTIDDNPEANMPNYYGMLEKEHPLYAIVLQVYVIDPMLYFLQLINKLKSGFSLDELKNCYPSGEEAIVPTQIYKTIHQSVEKKKVIDL